jgi:hypothetical protein
VITVEIFVLDVVILTFGMERVFNLFHLLIPKVLILLQLTVEVLASRFHLNNFASTEVGTEGGEVSRGGVGADPAMVMDAIDLAMTFFMTITADEVLIGPAAFVNDAFFRGGSRVRVKVVRDIDPDVGNTPSLGEYSHVLRTPCDHHTLPVHSGVVLSFLSTVRRTL